MRLPFHARRAIRQRKQAATDRLQAPDPILQINELARAARANWFALLSYLAFVGVTLIGVEDADFFLPERQTQLPLIGVTIPTALFFYIAPTLGAMLHVYVHLYLMKLWDALAQAPATRAGQPLSDTIMPWLVSDFALRFRSDGAVTRRPLWVLSFLVTLGLLFLAAPLVLGAFWWRSMPKHDWPLTIIACGIPLMAALHASIASLARLWRAGRHAGQAVPPDRRAPLRRWGRPALLTLTWAPLWAAIALVGFFRTVEPLDTYAAQLNLARLGWIEVRNLDEGSLWNALPINLARAQLADVVFTETPPGWLVHDQAFAAFRLDACRAEGLTPALCGPVEDDTEADDRVASVAATLASLRATWCARQFPPETAECDTFFTDLDSRIESDWRTQRANTLAALRAPNLAGADLRRANLIGARLEGANLQEAWMEGAILVGAGLEGANLQEAWMEGVNLLEAWMEGANLRGAGLEGADLSWARLEGATLVGAGLEGANLRGARLEGVNLLEARLEGANLRGARLEGANLSWARLEGAILRGARLDETTSLIAASLQAAAIKEVDLSTVPISQAQVNETFGDDSVTLPDGLTRPAHWPRHVLHLLEFYTEWRRWQADPAAYDPPERAARTVQ